VQFLGGLTRPTNSAELSINLDAGEEDVLLANATTAPIDFTRALTVYDSLGNPQSMKLEFTKTYGPQATKSTILTQLTATDEFVSNLGLTNGNRFSLTVDGGAPRVYQISNLPNQVPPGGVDVMLFDVGDLIDDINANVPNMEAFLGNAGEIVLQHEGFTAGTETFSFVELIGTPLASMGFTVAGAAVSDDLTPSTIYSNGTSADSPPYSSGDFPGFQFLPGDINYNNRGWWQVRILDPNNNQLTQGLVNFNGDGTLNAIQDNAGNKDIELDNIDWNNGSNLQTIDIDISRFSQFSSDYSVLFSDQDGAELGLRTGVTIDRNGFVIAQFSNGASSTLYKLPLVTFANANGLTEVSGTAYSKADTSGEENLREAGTGGAGFIEPATLENSNVDLADEFALLIVSQRAYSAGTKVINTVDQMTQELLQLR
jgi:flagellar hook protein FlgE